MSLTSPVLAFRGSSACSCSGSFQKVFFVALTTNRNTGHAIFSLGEVQAWVYAGERRGSVDDTEEEAK
jgi:hypothetical protein